MFRSKTLINNRKIRIGVIGCGRISSNHFNAILENNIDYSLVAVCDVDPDVVKETSNRLGVQGYDNVEGMLEKEELDIVALCTPSGLHCDHTLLAARKKIHVVTEKPLATNFDDGRAMVKAADDANIFLFVVKQNRYNKSLQLLKQAIDDQRFGGINLVNINVFWTRPQSYYDQGNGWRGTWEFDGGAFMNQASHYVDLLHWLIGPVECVQAMTTTKRRIEAEDTGVLNVKWRNGALGSMNVTMLTYPKNIEGSITILGDRGSVKIGGLALNEIQDWRFEDQKQYDNDIDQANYTPNSVYGNGHSTYYERVAKVLRFGGVPDVDGREGLKTLEILSAAYLSARDGYRIGLPLIHKKMSI